MASPRRRARVHKAPVRVVLTIIITSAYICGCNRRCNPLEPLGVFRQLLLGRSARLCAVRVSFGQQKRRGMRVPFPVKNR